MVRRWFAPPLLSRRRLAPRPRRPRLSSLVVVVAIVVVVLLILGPTGGAAAAAAEDGEARAASSAPPPPRASDEPIAAVGGGNLRAASGGRGGGEATPEGDDGRRSRRGNRALLVDLPDRFSRVGAAAVPGGDGVNPLGHCEGPYCVWSLRLSLPSVAYAPEAEDDMSTQQEAVISRLSAAVPEVEVIGRLTHVLNGLVIRIPRDTDEGKLREAIANDDELSGSVSHLSRDGTYELELEETVGYVWGTPPGNRVDPSPGVSEGNNKGDGIEFSGPSEWGYDSIDGSGVTVAVLDSGVDYTHATMGGPGTLESYAAAISEPTERGPYFPTAKVTDGYDFVGRDGTDGVAGADPDPIDAGGHGTAVADIIAGVQYGVAPGANIMAVKICYPSATGGCPGTALLLGMDYAVKNGADIINLSLGGTYGQPFDDDMSSAIAAAAELGILTVAAAGNCGDVPFCTASPGASAAALSVAQTETPRGSSKVNVLRIGEGGADADADADDAEDVEAVAFLWTGLPPEDDDADADVPLIEGDLIYAPGGDDDNALGCDPYPEDLWPSISGKFVLVDRGVCFFSTKMLNVQEAGGAVALIVNNVPGRPFSGGNGDGAIVSIPAYMIGLEDGQLVKDRLAAAAAPTIPASILPSPPGRHGTGWTVSTSGRGPDLSYRHIKPEIGAPGASIAAVVGTGDGAAVFGGTSGASPVVAGAAALLKQWCPGCGPLALKALLMNNAHRNIKSDTDGLPAAITRIGAGELRIGPALSSTLYAYDVDTGQPALSLGDIDVYTSATLRRKVKVVNLSKYDERRVRFEGTFRSEGKASSGAVRVSMEAEGSSSTDAIVVGPCGERVVDVVFRLNADACPTNHMNSGERGQDPDALGMNEFDGYVVFTATGAAAGGGGIGGTTTVDGEESISLPWHAILRRSSFAFPTRTILHDTSPDGRPDYVRLSNNGAGTAQVGAYDLVAVSDEMERGRRSAEEPLADIRAVGVRTERTDEEECDSMFAMEFAISTWDRLAHSVQATFFVSLDVDMDGKEDYVVYNQGGSQVAVVFNSSSVETTSKYYVGHGTNSKTTVLRFCGEQIGLSLEEDILSPPLGPSPIGAIVTVSDTHFASSGDDVDRFYVKPFGERFTLGTTENRTDRTSFGDAYDAAPKSIVSLPIYDAGENNASYANPSSLGLLLVTDAAREGEGNNGASTEDSEAFLLLAPGVEGPKPLSPAEDDDVVRVQPVTLSDPTTLTCRSLPTERPTSSPTVSSRPSVSHPPSVRPTTSPRPSATPSGSPSARPSGEPTAAPTTSRPTDVPTTLQEASSRLGDQSSSSSSLCISDTTFIYDAEVGLDATSSGDLRTYVLCPDTTYAIGVWDSDLAVYVDGMAPLELFRPNMRVLCGDDGSSANGCVFEGGEFHAYAYYERTALSNVLISGVTFRGATDVNVYTNAPTDGGGIVFRDCIFRDNANEAVVLAATDPPFRSILTLDSCLFESNSVPPAETLGAIVYNMQQNMTIVNSTFLDNRAPPLMTGEYGNETVALTSVVGNYFEGYLEMRDNCFGGNDVSLAVAVSLDATTVVAAEGGGGDNRVDGNTFNADFAGCDGLVDVDDLTCTEFVEGSCGGGGAPSRKRRRRRLRGTTVDDEPSSA